MNSTAIAAVQAAGGITLAAAPAVLDRPLPALAAARPRVLVRLLGLRMLLQAGMALADPQTARASAVVDLAHCGSMIATALAAPKYRTAAAASATVAALFAAANGIAGRQ